MNKTAEHLQDKIEANEAMIRACQQENQKLEKQKEVATQRSGIEKWLDFQFESGCVVTQEWKDFWRDFKKEFCKQLQDNHIVIAWNPNHFEGSCFVKNTTNGNLVYINISDVRFWKNAWYEDILIRTAKHDKDWTGGANNSCKFRDLPKEIERLTTIHSWR